MDGLETKVGSGIMRIVTKGPEIGLAIKCMELAQKEDELLQHKTGDEYYVRKAVKSHVSAYLMAWTGIAIEKDNVQHDPIVTAKKLGVLAGILNDNLGWLQTYRRKAKLVEMPDYASDIIQRASKHRRDLIVAEADALLESRGAG